MASPAVAACPAARMPSMETAACWMKSRSPIRLVPALAARLRLTASELHARYVYAMLLFATSLDSHLRRAIIS